MQIALSVLGGLGLFLYGMNKISENLQKSAGNRLRNIIQALTKNTFMSILVGGFVTMLLQSSSGTSVMVVSFVNAGLMNLTQAVGVLMGANIGTTFTSQLIAFNVSEYAPFLVILGVAISLSAKKERIKNIADVLTGVGILFIGMDMMGNGLKVLSEFPQFGELMVQLNNPVLGVLLGFVFTAAVQSSSASVGLLQALGTGGLINMTRAFPILIGSNMGTTTTGIISSIGANKNAKKTAYLNLLINMIGGVIFILILQGPIERVVVAASPDNISRQIANSHTLFNVIAMAIQVPFIKYLVGFVNRLVPDDEEVVETATMFLDDRLAEKTPAIAIGQVNKEVVHMTEVILESLYQAKEAIFSVDLSLIEELEEREELINTLDEEITNYLLDLSNNVLSDEPHSIVNRLMYIVNDLERIGDHIDNLKEITEVLGENDLRFTESSLAGLAEMFDQSTKMVEKIKESLEFSDRNMAYDIIEMERNINQLEKQNKEAHLDQINKKEVNLDAGINFLEAISNLERLSDHAFNIATHILNTFPK